VARKASEVISMASIIVVHGRWTQMVYGVEAMNLKSLYSVMEGGQTNVGGAMCSVSCEVDWTPMYISIDYYDARG
jgi:hypothetical protein